MISYSDAGFTFADSSTQASAATPQIQSLGISLASNAVTIASQAYSLAFKTSLTSGATTTITGSPTALVIPSSATLGTTSAVASSIIVLALNNAGTLEYAVVNIAGGNDLSETGVISTTAISAAATSASVVYSTTARTSVPYRVVGRFDSTQATAGTWATNPTLVQGVGGQAAGNLIVRNALNVSGIAPTYACRAWCIFNGTTTGTNAPTAGGNVTSVTRLSAGQYAINFTTAMPDANYSIQMSSKNTVTNIGTSNNTDQLSPTTTTCTVVHIENNAETDSSKIHIAIFR